MHGPRPRAPTQQPDGGAVSTRSASERPNIRQVATTAGVSHMTVSRVLNGHANIKESTRLKVLAAVEELGYRPNIAARALATQKRSEEHTSELQSRFDL